MTGSIAPSASSPSVNRDDPSKTRQPKFAPVQHGPDLLQRNAEKLERDNLLQPLQIARAVHPVPRLGAQGPQQPEPVVVMQRPHRHARQLAELLYVHSKSLPKTIFRPDAG